MSRPDLANSTLFAALERAFGPALVSGQGQAARLDPHRRSGVTGGEHYRVCCPFCRESRHRLYVSALYGLRRPDGPGPAPGPGRDRMPRSYGTEVVVCYNAGCLHEGPLAEAQRDEFRRRVRNAQGLRALLPARTASLAPAAPAASRGALPAGLVPLDRLGPRHHAARYLAGRGFDAAFLAGYYGVRYCVTPPADMPALAGRVVMPVVLDGRLATWQARLVDDSGLRPGPKYYNEPGGVGKSRVLYNLDRAAAAPVAVLVEGITDVWRLGDRAASPLGKHLSEAQLGLVVSRFAERHRGVGVLAVMLDPDAGAELDLAVGALAPHLARFGCRVVRVACPDGRDPASLGYEASWHAIRAACAAAGLPRLPTDP